MRLGYKGPRGIVNEDGIGRVARQGVEAKTHRLRPAGPTMHKPPARQPRQGRLGQVIVARPYDYNQGIGTGGDQGAGRPGQDGLASEGAPLLSRAFASALTRARSDNECTKRHDPCFGQLAAKV